MYTRLPVCHGVLSSYVRAAGDYLHHDVGDMAGAGHVELPAAEVSNLEDISKVGMVANMGMCALDKWLMLFHV